MVLTSSQSTKIQMLRGIAIIAVVFIHNTPAGLTQIFCRPFLNFCVALFLFLSGMLSDASKWKPFKRIWKVAVPYVIWTVIYTYLSNSKASLSTLILFLVTGKASPIMYYIFVYCELTLLIPLIDKLAKSKFRIIGFFISPVEIIVMRMIPLLTGYEYNVYMRVIMSISFVSQFTYFYTGYLLGNGLMKLNLTTKKIGILWGASIILQMLETYWYSTMDSEIAGTQAKLSSLITSVLFCLLSYRFIYSKKDMEIKPLRLLGDCSFGIYFSHFAVMHFLKYIPHYYQIIYPFDAVIAIAASLLLVVIVRKIFGKAAKYLAF